MGSIINTKSFEEQQQLIINNLALVNYCIKKYIFIGDDEYEDLFQEGCLGLVLAARRFDPSKGYQFSTYAIRMITGTIKRYKNTKANRFRGLHVPAKHVERMNMLSKIMAEHNVDELTAEIIAESGLTAEEAGKLVLNIVSKDQPFELDSGELVSFEEVITDSVDNYLEVDAQIITDEIIGELQVKLMPYEFDIFEEIYYSYIIGGEAIKRKDLEKRYKVSHTTINRVILKIRKIINETLIKIR